MKKKVSIVLALVATLLLIAAPVFADTWEYYVGITIQDTGGVDRTGVPVILIVKGDNLHSAGYINATGTDTRVLESSTARGYLMVSDNCTAFIPSLAAFQTRAYNLYTGYTPVVTEFGLITGTGGSVSVADHAELELSDGFDIEIKGWINTSAGAGKNLIYKQDAFKLYVQAGSTIRAAILGGGDAEVLVATTPATVTSGEHTIRITADGVNLKIYIDTVEEASTALAGNSVPDNGNSWYFTQNDCLPYVEYITIKATDW